MFLSEVQAGVVPQTIWGYDEVGNTQEAKKSLLEFVPFDETENVLNSVKPPRLIQRMLQLSTMPSANETILDFFSGSAPTAHAVILQNGADGGNRRYICVQFPEPLPKPEANLRTISDIGTARIRSVAKDASTGEQSKLDLETLPDVGFRYLRLNTSNFKTWNADHLAEGEGALKEQLSLHIDHVLPDRSQEDILFEILLKAGYCGHSAGETWRSVGFLHLSRQSDRLPRIAHRHRNPARCRERESQAGPSHLPRSRLRRQRSTQDEHRSRNGSERHPVPHRVNPRIGNSAKALSKVHGKRCAPWRIRLTSITSSRMR